MEGGWRASRPWERAQESERDLEEQKGLRLSRQGSAIPPSGICWQMRSMPGCFEGFEKVTLAYEIRNYRKQIPGNQYCTHLQSILHVSSVIQCNVRIPHPPLFVFANVIECYLHLFAHLKRPSNCHP